MEHESRAMERRFQNAPNGLNAVEPRNADELKNANEKNLNAGVLEQI